MSAVLEIVGASLVLATVIVNESVTSPLLPSDTVISTSFPDVPTLAFNGVPVSVAVPSPLSVSDNHPGRVVPANDSESPSTSLADTVYV